MAAADAQEHNSYPPTVTRACVVAILNPDHSTRPYITTFLFMSHIFINWPKQPIHINGISFFQDEPTRKPVSVHDLEVRDSQGRVRFHGAFTGGFSAGYFNTVGSKEGKQE